MEKILVIDDDNAFRETVIAALQSQNFGVIEAENGRAGVRLAQEHLPDLVLSDIDMGSFDGFAALSAIRYHPMTSSIPVILMTGKPEESGRRFAMDIGANDYLAKPFTIQSLINAIRVQLKKWEAIKKQAVQLMPSESDQADLKALAEIIDSRRTTPRPKEPRPDGPPAAAPADLSPAWPSEIRLTPETAELALQIFLQMLETYHPNLGNTARRSMVLCRAIGSGLKLGREELNNLVWAAALCDIALVRVNHQIVRRWLRQPQNLQKDELALIREHPEQSARMLDAWPLLAGASAVIRSHQEHWDGTGFPEGLRGEQIPWLARILAAVIFFSSRYEHPRIVSDEMALQSGHLFDPKAVKLVVDAAGSVQLPAGAREILVTEMRAGLVLAQDLHNSSGVVLLPKGRRLTDAAVTRLMTINRSRPMSQSVLVYED